MIVNKHFVGREVAMDILTNSHSNWKQLTNREYRTDSATEYYTETNEICSDCNLFFNYFSNTFLQKHFWRKHDRRAEEIF